MGVVKGVLNYAYANINQQTAYITDDTFVFRGTWATGTLYQPPVDVVGYGNAKYLSLIASNGTLPTSSVYWSEMALVGTINPSDPLAVAQAAFNLANQAYVIAVAGSNLAFAANVIAAAGSNLAYQAFVLAQPLHGTGAPAGTLGLPGQTYVDDVSDGIYWKSVHGWNP